MAKLLYENKEDIYVDSSIPDKNKVKADDMNEIKEVVNANENKILLAMSDTAPSTCATGDLYYNTTSKKIFEATDTNTWGTTGTNPTPNTIYILFDTKTTYSYDGTDLVSVGGGGAEISIGTTQPSEDEVLWINPTQSTNQAKYKYNNTWKELSIKALDSMPIGSIIGFAGSDIPNGWLICDGSTLDEETYPELYDALGGSGSTFTLPDYQSRVPVGYDANDTDFNAIGKTGGSKELQKHSHSVVHSAETINVQAGSSATCVKNYPYTTTGETGTGNSGNLQPYIVQYFIIKAKNTTPTMASIVNATNNSTTDGYSCDYINKLNVVYSLGNKTINANTSSSLGTLPSEYQGYDAYIISCEDNGQYLVGGVNQSYTIFGYNLYNSQLTFKNVKVICIGKNN